MEVSKIGRSNAMVFMCAVLRLRRRSRSPLHMKKRSCAATRAFPRLQAGAGALGAVSAPAQALAYPHCMRNRASRNVSCHEEIKTETNSRRSTVRQRKRGCR